MGCLGEHCLQGMYNTELTHTWCSVAGNRLWEASVNIVCKECITQNLHRWCSVARDRLWDASVNIVCKECITQNLHIRGVVSLGTGRGKPR